MINQIIEAMEKYHEQTGERLDVIKVSREQYELLKRDANIYEDDEARINGARVEVV